MKYIIVSVFLLILFLIFSTVTLAQRGCCSHHGGVCGNSCCDGSALSAACGGGNTIFVPNNTTTANDVFPFLPTPTPPIQWCGAGQWYSTKDAAQASIDSYKTDILKPYVDLQSKYDTANWKKWLFFVSMIVFPIVAYNRGKKWSENFWTLLIWFIFLGGFLLFWPF